MSAHIPFDIQAQIMKKLPAKTLIQFKMVSKPWKSLIESSEFMGDYNRSETGPNHLFIRYNKRYWEKEHVSVLDDYKTFPQHRIVHTLPDSLKLLGSWKEPRIVGSSHGLFCLYGYSISACNFNIVIWNPSINKSIALDMGEDYNYFCRIGFGVRRDTLDPMLVKIINDEHDLPRFEVFRLSTGVWTTIPTSNLPRKSIEFTADEVNQVDVNGIIYWSVEDMVSGLYLIVSFDMKTEKFLEVNVPKCLASNDFWISKLRESLGVLKFYQEAESQKQVCAVWMMMEDGVQKSFTKLYTISTQVPLLEVPGFRSCGKPIVATRTTVDDDKAGVLLSVYDPHSKNIDALAIHREHSILTLFVSSYTETLLLLDHPDNHGKPIPYRRRTIY